MHTIFKAVMICVICAVTLMSGCIEERTSQGFLVESDGTVNPWDHKMTDYQKQAIENAYRCDLSPGTYYLNTSYPEYLNGPLNEIGIEITKYENLHINGFIQIGEDGHIFKNDVRIYGDDNRYKSKTIMFFIFKSIGNSPTCAPGFVEHQNVICEEYTIHNLDGDRTSRKTESTFFIESIVRLASETGKLSSLDEQIISPTVPRYDARNFTEIYPEMSIHQINSLSDENKFGQHVFGWMAVLDGETIDGDLKIQHYREEKRGGDYITEFRGYITYGNDKCTETRKSAILGLIN